MAWRVVEIWKDHEIRHRDGSVSRVRAQPWWDPARGCYRVFPFGNENADAVECTTLDEVYGYLGTGFGLRVKHPEAGTNAILRDGFEARLKHFR